MNHPDVYRLLRIISSLIALSNNKSVDLANNVCDNKYVTDHKDKMIKEKINELNHKN